jgi:hypothetical protein
MNLTTKISVHGNSVVPQFAGGALITSPGPLLQVNDGSGPVPWSDVVGLRQGPGVIYRGKAGTTNFFHVSIPSPDRYPIYFTALQGGPDSDDPTSPLHHNVEKVCSVIRIRFIVTLDVGVTVMNVFAFDGRNLLPGLPINPGGADNITIPEPRIISDGLGISFEVRFGSEGNIVFHGVSAEFSLLNLD